VKRGKERKKGRKRDFSTLGGHRLERKTRKGLAHRGKGEERNACFLTINAGNRAPIKKGGREEKRAIFFTAGKGKKGRSPSLRKEDREEGKRESF